MPTNGGKFSRVVIGIDEVGRGALAGPVVLAAVVLERRPPAASPIESFWRGRAGIRWLHPEFGRIRDSKQLTPRRREAWFRYLTRHPGLRWRIARVGPAVIDHINIARAANLGALRLYRRMASTDGESVTNKRMVRRGSPQVRKFAKNSSFVDGRAFALLDGGLSLPAGIPQRTIIKGDERVPLIAAASIIAKVWRDRSMARLAIQIPRYGFDIHNGYGTRYHKRMIRRHGPSEIHRRTFLTRLNAKS